MLEIVEEYVILTLSTYFNNDLITNRKKQPLFIPFKLNLFFGPNRGTMVPNTAGDVINIQHYCCLRCKLYLYGWLSICLFFDEQIVLVQIESLVCNLLAYQVIKYPATNVLLISIRFFLQEQLLGDIVCHYDYCVGLDSQKMWECKGMSKTSSLDL